MLRGFSVYLGLEIKVKRFKGNMNSDIQLNRMLPHKTVLYVVAFILILTAGCRKTKEEDAESVKPVEGTFAYDREFLSRFQDVLVLSSPDSQAQVLLCPAFQGRVMTSTAQGDAGRSFGWINHELIASGKRMQKINSYGGEDRFWLGPEGGQFSIFFRPGENFVFDDWATPAVIDTDPFELISSSNREAVFGKEMELNNYSGNTFSLRVDRRILLFDDQMLSSELGVLPSGVSTVGFTSENTITNTGSEPWTREGGTLSIWILGMFNPSPGTTIVIPFRQEAAAEGVGIVKDDYFGKVPEDRLEVADGAIFFSGDGKYRSKIGVGPKYALPWAGSYDEESRVLTLIHFSFDETNEMYVNSMWAIQDEPFGGDVVNAYNDGPVNGGPPLGPFYELESSSPAAFLDPGESILHIHRTFHITGEEASINAVAMDKLGVGLDAIKSVF